MFLFSVRTKHICIEIKVWSIEYVRATPRKFKKGIESMKLLVCQLMKKGGGKRGRRRRKGRRIVIPPMKSGARYCKVICNKFSYY